MVRFIVRAAFAGLGLWLADRLLPGVWFSDAGTLILASVLLGVVNAVVRPVVVFLTFPITLVTLGLFLLVVNGAMIGLVAFLLEGFAVRSLGAGIGAAVITGLISWIGTALTTEPRRS